MTPLALLNSVRRLAPTIARAGIALVAMHGLLLPTRYSGGESGPKGEDALRQADSLLAALRDRGLATAGISLITMHALLGSGQICGAMAVGPSAVRQAESLLQALRGGRP